MKSKCSRSINLVVLSLLLLTQTMCAPVSEATPVSGITLTVINSTVADICAVSAAVLGTSDRDDNILEATLRPGESFILTDLEAMNVDLVAFDCSGEIVNAAYDMHIGAAATWEITKQEAVAYEPPSPPPALPDQTWLVLLYMDADDELLEQAMYLDLNEAELIGSSAQVQIVAQMDRYEGGFAGDGDWNTAKRFYLTQDTDLNALASEEIADLGEVNMADKNTLVDFVSWAVETYPADKYVLILSDHGSGWPGGWSDQSAGDDTLTLVEIENALADIQNETGIEQFELIGFDACLMSSIEVFTAISPYARYAVASEEVEPAIGWAYTSILMELVNGPGMTGAHLGEVVVRTYIDGDIALVDAPRELVEQMQASVTMAAVDLAVIPDLLAALDAMLVEVSEIDQGNVAQARYFSQAYFSIFGKGVPQSFLDLGHLTQMLSAEGKSPELSQATEDLLNILGAAVIAEKHGPQRPGSTGVSIYFPNSVLYGAYDFLPGSNVYVSTVSRFAAESLWDDFLLFHYTGASMPAVGAGTTAMASANATVTGPGVGQIEIAPVSASSDVFSMENPVFLSTEITGGHVAQIFLYRGLYVEESNAILLLYNGYLPADTEQEINGVVFPDWDAQTVNGVLSLGGSLWPENLVVTDGTAQAVALLVPEQYGGGGIYQVYGFFTSVATEDRYYAMMRFNLDSAQMLNLIVFTEQGGTLVPREYSPQLGDQFTTELTWIDLGTGEQLYSEGDTLTFGSTAFWLDAIPSIPGQYLIGAKVVDLDGNSYRQEIWMTVEAD